MCIYILLINFWISSISCLFFLPLTICVMCIYILLINFWISSISCLFFLPLTGPALGEAPASGPWGFRHHGTSRRHTPTSTQARRRAGNGEERGRTPALTTPPRSRSRAPTSRTASSPPQSGARGLVTPQNIPQRKLCGPSPRQGAHQRPVGVPSSRNLEAPDAHQRASTPQGRERGRAGANPSACNPATLPL